MKITIKTNDQKTASRIIKSEKMAIFIWELKHNLLRPFEHDENYEKIVEVITEELDNLDINIDNLIE